MSDDFFSKAEKKLHLNILLTRIKLIFTFEFNHKSTWLKKYPELTSTWKSSCPWLQPYPELGILRSTHLQQKGRERSLELALRPSHRCWFGTYSSTGIDSSTWAIGEVGRWVSSEEVHMIISLLWMDWRAYDSSNFERGKIWLNMGLVNHWSAWFPTCHWVNLVPGFDVNQLLGFGGEE